MFCMDHINFNNTEISFASFFLKYKTSKQNWDCQFKIIYRPVLKKQVLTNIVVNRHLKFCVLNLFYLLKKL